MFYKLNIMENLFDNIVRKHLPIKEVNIFSEETVLPYKKPPKKKIVTVKDYNNLTNEKILNIISNNNKYNLNYQYFSISSFLVENNEYFVFFTQKINGVKDKISQIFFRNKPIVIVETNSLIDIQFLIENHIFLGKKNINQLINNILKYEYK